MGKNEWQPSIVYRSLFKTTIGWCGLVNSERGIVRLLIGYPRREQLLKGIAHQFGSTARCASTKENMVDQIKSYCSGEKVIFDQWDLDWSFETPFQKRVYQAAMNIPYGTTETYGGLARKCDCPSGSRAVGNALASNPFPLVVPCHRVVRKTGELGGFSGWGGMALKERLLKLEGVVVHFGHVPFCS